MSHQDLIAALHAQGTEKADQMRRQAEEEEARLAVEAKERLDTLEEEEKLAKLAEEERLRAATVVRTRLEARRLLAAARCHLAERLTALAQDCLSTLRDRQYETTFARLIDEIPSENWSQVRLHPDDAALARKFLPTTPMVEDETIVGGFELTSADGLLRIANTLNKRLEKIWPSLLPKIVEQAEKQCPHR